MSQTISLPGFPSKNILSQTKLTADVATAVTSLPVNNSNDFVAGFVLIGAPGSSQPEIATITDPSESDAIPVAATVLAHNSDDQVYQLFGNQLEIWSAPDTDSVVPGSGQQPLDSFFTLVDTIPINANQKNTSYTDADGTTTTWYKYVFKNSVSSATTALADSTADQAGAVHYVSLDDIRSSAGFDDAPQITDNRIAKFRNAAEKEINGSLAAIINLPFPQPINPIIVQIAKNIAAGELMQDAYNTISPTIAMQGATKASTARHGSSKGDNPYTSLQDLTERTVVLQDTNYNDLTADDAVGFSGYPDNTTNGFGNGPDKRRNFSVDEEY